MHYLYVFKNEKLTRGLVIFSVVMPRRGAEVAWFYRSYLMSVVISSNKTLFSFPRSVSIFIFWWWQGPWEQSEKQPEPINSFILTLGSWEGELVLRLLPLKWFLFTSALSSEWFGYDPDWDQEDLPEDRRQTASRELRPREISLYYLTGVFPVKENIEIIW